ncbi:MAG: ferredoxin [Paracoccaceae bacterium]
MTSTYDDIYRKALALHLEVFGAFHPAADDGAPCGCQTLLLLGPKEPGFWHHFKQTQEFLDDQPDPMDRWSNRVVRNLANDLDGSALFPFDGRPYAPFILWATRSGRAWASPVTLLVHDSAGLFLSYRGAIALPNRIILPAAPPCPCDICVEQPCKTACPVSALSLDDYDLPSCHAYLDSPEGQDCMAQGCAVRRACPVSQTYDRRAVQSAHHMKAFHP